MTIKYPEVVFEKSCGSTESESYLSRLCEKTFLSLWSYPNCYRDQGRSITENGTKKGDGKELCDLLAVFENNIYIFSDKDCAFPEIEDIEVAWSRWYRKAIDNAASQIFGAERWILENPKQLFLDKSCNEKVPISIPTKDVAYVHRIVIAHGAAEKCKAYFQTDSGSLIINNQIHGKQHYSNHDNHLKPFHIGMVNPDKGFVHVFDDYSLDIVMRSMDTVSDFTDYIIEKEKLLLSNRSVYIAGEEELVALYLTSSDGTNPKNLSVYFDKRKYDSLMLIEGTWQSYLASSLPSRLNKANEISYLWDDLIERFLYHLSTGTSNYLSDPDIKSQEEIFRLLASENRFKRRILSKTLLDLLYKSKEYQKATTIIPPKSPNLPAYVFLVLYYPKNIMSYPDYQELRRGLLTDLVQVAKYQYQHFRKIIGIATDAIGEIMSEDIVLMDTINWTAEDFHRAEQIKKEFSEHKIIGISEEKHERFHEYPKIDTE